MNFKKADIKNFIPITYFKNNLLLGKLNSLYVSDLKLKKIQYIVNICELSFLLKILYKIRFIQRILRYEIGPGILLDGDDIEFLIHFQKNVYRVNLNQKKVTKEKIKGHKRK